MSQLRKFCRLVDRVLSRLKRKRTSGEGWIALCPAHNDHNPSLHIRERADGSVRLKCFAGCQLADILRALGLKERDLCSKRRHGEDPERQQGHKAGAGAAGPWRTIAKYVYRAESGKRLFRVTRQERGKRAEREKKFFQERYENHRWVKGLGNLRRVPYQLDKVVRAERIYIPEGEKDCRTLRKFGLVGTTNAMGAGKWSPDYNQYFAGKRVIIFPDNDEPGRKHAIQVAENLLLVAKSVRIVQLPDLPEKGDVTDWVYAGGTLKELRKLWRAEAPLNESSLAELTDSWGFKDKQAHFPFRVSDKGVFF